MKISLAGAGMGGEGLWTRWAAEAVRCADAVIGAARWVEGVPGGIAEVRAERIAELVGAHPEWRRVCVVLGGDPGFHSGAARVAELLGEEHEIVVVPGISSPQYFAARLRRAWQGFRLVSAHGVDCDVLAEVLNHPSVFFLTGGKVTPGVIAEELCAAGLGGVRMAAGENLSLPDEKITEGCAEDFRGAAFAPLSVALVENGGKTFARAAGSGGIPDGEFVRGDAPMTKREVRAVALSLLGVREGDVVYDAGAGTGSVAVEAALAARRGRVYAVEREDAAAELLLRNREKFGVYNLVPVRGVAPDALAGLPAPDAVFVGGSGGALGEIVNTVLRKNPACRVVVSAITLETLAAAMAAVPGAEATQVAAGRSVVRGGYHMMEALNPVFLVSGGGRGRDE